MAALSQICSQLPEEAERTKLAADLRGLGRSEQRITIHLHVVLRLFTAVNSCSLEDKASRMSVTPDGFPEPPKRSQLFFPRPQSSRCRRD
jgi:hypothetical protein